MKNLRYATVIDAPREAVWRAMLEDESYRAWTAVFMPGSHYAGSWDEGSEIRFLGPDGEGGVGGMRSRIAKHVPHEFVSIEHLAEIHGEAETPFAVPGGTFENYAFADRDGGTEVVVELLNIPDEWESMMGDAWPKALAKLKEIAEQREDQPA